MYYGGIKVNLINYDVDDFDDDGVESRAYISSTRHTLDVILKQDTSDYSILLERNHLPYIIQMLDNGPFTMRQEVSLYIFIN